MCSESSPGAFRDSQEWYVVLKSYYKVYYSTLAVCFHSQVLLHSYWSCDYNYFYFNMAKNHKSLSFTYTEEMKKPCIEADLVPTLIPLLESTDQEMLLHAGRAIGRICYDNRKS